MVIAPPGPAPSGAPGCRRLGASDDRVVPRCAPSGYAPELRLIGVAAAAPATELAALMRADMDTFGGKNLTAMTLWSWARVYDAPIDAVLDPAAMPVVDALAGECLESIYDFIVRRRTSKGLDTGFLRVADFAQAQPWASLLAQNTPGPLPSHIPVFLAQGSADTLVLPRVTRDYMRRLCANGSAVAMLTVPNTGHGFVAFKASNAAVGWIDGPLRRQARALKLQAIICIDPIRHRLRRRTIPISRHSSAAAEAARTRHCVSASS